MMPNRRAPSLRLTHADRVVDASSGSTKLDVARYYFSVAALMLPHLRDRPVTLVRAPDGIGYPTFFQKHAIGRASLQRTDGSFGARAAIVPWIRISQTEELVAAVQANAVEFHIGNATAGRPDEPNQIVLDLDPGQRVGFDRVREAAMLVRALVEELGLRAFLKTSGGRGLHVIVPIARGCSWQDCSAFSQAVALHLQRTFPTRFSATSGEHNRVGRVFVDWMRNARTATTVSAWSLRARPGLGASVPVTWDELDTISSGSQWTLRTIGERLDGNERWQGFARARRSLRAAAAQLAAVR